jgi:pyruvate kinase
MRRTKIIATVGPASNSDAALDALMAAGTDVFRLNFSHGTHATQGESFARIRAASSRAGCEAAILQDLGGPKIRTGRLQGGQPITVKPGDRLRITTGDGAGAADQIYTAFDGLARSVRKGDRLLLADGLIELRVEGTDGAEIETVVVDGGEIGEHKGINAPGVPLPVSAVTPKDAADLAFGLSLGVDMVAISFVQGPADLAHARDVLSRCGRPDVPLIAKFERPQALDNLEGILGACDGVMVARGDLGLEIPLEQVPRAQNAIIHAARRKGLPVILATQVLESMTKEARPTRAEVSDAANAVDASVDAIMLAGETAVGAAPAHVVRTLDAIIRDAELHPDAERSVVLRRGSDEHDHQMAICVAATTLAEQGAAAAIIAVTRAGGTARRLSMLRPNVPVVAATRSVEIARRLALYWGVTPVHLDLPDRADLTAIAHELGARGAVPAGAAVVLVNINPDLKRQDANYLRIQQL